MRHNIAFLLRHLSMLVVQLVEIYIFMRIFSYLKERQDCGSFCLFDYFFFFLLSSSSWMIKEATEAAVDSFIASSSNKNYAAQDTATAVLCAFFHVLGIYYANFVTRLFSLLLPSGYVT